MTRIGTIVIALSAILLTSCGLTRREQLHRVAKDWCETIRASQIIAVYPLTEDIQPGDIFLVQTPIDKQQQIYKQRGFLPLDNHIARVNPDGYAAFYANSFLAEGDVKLPVVWMDQVWESAPTAAFPSYSFNASSGGGLNLAIPVSGVPVGLSLLATSDATGTVSLKDARTIGVDSESLYQQILNSWATESPERIEFLAGFAPPSGQPPRNFLRVVSRVYLLGEIDVEITDARTLAAGADVQTPKPIELFLPTKPTDDASVVDANRASYTDGIDNLNQMMAMETDGTPGASFRFNAASTRSVSLTETFDRPLVVGYLGFDIPITADGGLGRPIPTHALLDGELTIERPLPAEGAATFRTAAVRAAANELATDNSDRAQALQRRLDALHRFVPESMRTVDVTDLTDPSSGLTVSVTRPRAGTAFSTYLAHRINRDSARNLLESSQESGLPITEDSEVLDDDETNELLRELSPSNAEESAYRAAVRSLFEYMRDASN